MRIFYINKFLNYIYIHQKLNRKLSFFSIYASNVIIINIMEKDINRKHGANIDLFEILFEAYTNRNTIQTK